MGLSSANKILFSITLVLKIIGLKAAGEFSILYTPDSLRFMATDKTTESNLKEIFSAALGLSVEHSSEWKGLIVVDPFNTPEAAVEVYIDGISSIGENIALNTYKLSVDEYEPDTYKSVKERIKQHFTEGGNKIANVKLSNGHEFRKLLGNFIKKKTTKDVLEHLKQNVEEDYLFMNELEILRAVIQWIQDGGIVPDNQIDFFNFRIRSLHGVSDYHGPHSKETKEAKKLLGKAVQELSKAFVKAYVGSVLVTAVSTDVPHTTRRSARSVSIPDLNVTETKWLYDYKSPIKKKNRYKFVKPAGIADYEWMSRAIVRPRTGEGSGKEDNQNENEDQNESETGLGNVKLTENQNSSNSGSNSTNSTSAGNATVADEFDVDYPAVFNIFLWFGLVMTFTMISIMYSFMDMDPGRDTIIYRMTSMKMKKDL